MFLSGRHVEKEYQLFLDRQCNSGVRSLLTMKIFALVAAAMTLAACGGGTTSTPAGTGGPPAPDVSGGSASATTDGGTVPFGGATELGPGLKVGASVPVPYNPDSGAAGVVSGGRNFAVTMQLTNNSQSKFNAYDSLRDSPAAGQTDCERVFDDKAGQETPHAAILPGKSKSWTVAYSCKAASGSDLQLDVSRDDLEVTATFVGKLP